MSTHKPLSIVMVAACPFPANHGSAASIREMSDQLVKLGHKVHIVTYPIREDIPIGDVVVHRVNVPFMTPGKVKVGPAKAKFLYNPLMILKLISVVLRHRIDVIHAHNYEGAMVGWVAKILTGRPMLYNAVNTMADELPTYNFIRPRAFAVWLGKVLDRWVPRAGDVVTVVSDALRSFLVEGGLDPGKVIVVPAGVNLDMFEGGDPAKIRQRHGLGDCPLVMYTGALEEFQRVDYLLKAMRVVVDHDPSARLMVVGNIFNALQKDKYIQLATELGILDQVVFVDSVPLCELKDYLSAADVAVVPRPDCPGHPVKLLNYMAAGRAIVSFRGGAKGLHHMYNGCLVEDHDFVGLGERIRLLLERPDLRRALGEKALATIAGNFDWETLARGIVVLYRHLVERTPAIDREALHRYIREGYVLQYANRLDRPERRRGEIPIEFLERRELVFGPAPLSKAHSPNPETTKVAAPTLAMEQAGSRDCAVGEPVP